MRKMHRVLAGTTITVMTLVGLGCSSDDGDDVCTDEVVTSVDEDGDFSTYETFAIFELPDGGAGMGGGGPSVEMIENLETANEAAAAELKALGLEEVDPDEETPDLWIGSAALAEGEEGVYWECVPGWTWWGWYAYWDPCAWIVPIDFEYTVGTLAVALVDSSSEEPVFGGLVQGILECNDDIDGRIESGVAQIFDDYPDD